MTVQTTKLQPNMLQKIKTTQIIGHYLSFSRGEQRGIVILAAIILAVNIFRFYWPDDKRIATTDVETFRQEMKEFEQSVRKESRLSRASFSGNLPFSLPDRGKSGKHDSGVSVATLQYQAFVIELNSADTLDLQRLRGIGPSFARRITSYRQKLGGFVSIGQVLEVYGMDSARYLGIRDHLMVDSTAVQRMNLNSVSFKDLIAHPYMWYELAKEIALYRKKHKTLSDLQELTGMKSYDSIQFIKLRPYISFE